MHSLKKQLFNASALATIVVIGLLLVTFRIAFYNSALGELLSTVSEIRYLVMEQRYYLADNRYDNDYRLKEYLKSSAKFKEQLFKFQTEHPEISYRANEITNQYIAIHKVVVENLDLSFERTEPLENEADGQDLMQKLEPMFDDMILLVGKMKKEIKAYQEFQYQRLAISIVATIFASLFLLLALSYMHAYSINKFFEQFDFVSKRISEGKFFIGKSKDWFEEIWHLVDSFKELGGFEREKMEFVRSQLYDLEKFRSIVDNLDDGVLLMDADGFVVYANQKLVSQAGYTSNELIGQRPAHWRGEGVAEKLSDIWRLVVKEHKIYEGNIPAVNKLNHEYSAITKVFPILSHTKDLRFMVAVERGIDKCLDINSFGTEMPSIISHQIKAPLQTVATAIELLSNKRTSLNKTEIIDTANQAIAHIKKVVNEMLDSFKAESNSFKIKKEEISLAGIFKDVRKTIDSLVKQTKTDLSFSVPRSFPQKIITDYNIIYEVMEIVVHNAIVYSSKKRSGGEVKVSASMDGGNIIITVADNGIGIPESMQPMIFSPFYRAENAVRHSPEGTGIGLYFAKKAIMSLGGSISFESKEGKGTVFTIKMPSSR